MHGFPPLIIFAKRSILIVWLGSEYAAVNNFFCCIIEFVNKHHYVLKEKKNFYLSQTKTLSWLSIDLKNSHLLFSRTKVLPLFYDISLLGHQGYFQVKYLLPLLAWRLFKGKPKVLSYAEGPKIHLEDLNLKFRLMRELYKLWDYTPLPQVKSMTLRQSLQFIVQMVIISDPALLLQT